MNRFLMTVAVAVVGLTTLAAAQTRAEGHSGRGSGHSSSDESRHESMSGRQFHASRRFDYDKHGYRSLSWTHSYWSSYYGRYCYWAPSYGWCFYEPSYSCYLPVSCYSEVYPEAVAAGPAPAIPSPTTIQQTTVVVAPSAPTDVPVPPPASRPDGGPADQRGDGGRPIGGLAPRCRRWFPPRRRSRKPRSAPSDPNDRRSTIIEAPRRRADQRPGTLAVPATVGPASGSFRPLMC